MYILSKIIIAIISPLGSALALLLAAVLISFLNFRRLVLGLSSVAIAWLWLWSLPVASDWLLGQMEARYPVVAVQELPVAQAIVVLGGAMRAATASHPIPGLNAASDRVWHAARLFHANKAPLLVLSGAAYEQVSVASEAHAMSLLLHDLNVPDSAMLLEGESRTTQENARFTALLLQQRGVKHILLVTSAFHMRRAVSHFEAAGFQVTPAATDHADSAKSGLLAWLPDAVALEVSSRGFKEAVAVLVGR